MYKATEEIGTVVTAMKGVGDATAWGHAQGAHAAQATYADVLTAGSLWCTPSS